MTLREWQQTIKSEDELLYNCSEFTHLNDEWVPFPIGMGWSVINYNGQIKNIQIGLHNNMVLCAIRTHTDKNRRGNYHINRENIVNTLINNNIHNVELNFSNYFKELPTYKFVISPEGNGIDCHRHYESLMAGCIPIIEEHPGIREKYAGCPVLYTKDYSEITEDYLKETYTCMLDTVYDFSKLMLSSYDSSTQNEIKSNGNYWARRLSGRNWY